MNHGTLGFLRTDIVRYARHRIRRRIRGMAVACIVLDILAITAFVTGVVVVFSLFDRV